MYLSNTTFSFLNNSNSVFQNHNLFAVNSGLLTPAGKPQTTLQKLSNQITTNQVSGQRLEDLSKSAQIRMDTYVETDSPSSLDEASDEVLEVYLHIFKVYSTFSEGYEQELSDFKEQLQGWDSTIQSYQDILDGKSPLQEGQTMEDVLMAYAQAKQDREQFFEDGIAHINKYNYGDFASNKTVDHYMQAVMGENKFAEKDSSVWKIDSNASDIYSEIDRVLSEVHSVTEEFHQGVDRIYGILKERGYGEQYQSYLSSWNNSTNSYFDQTEEMNIQKLMIERLMNQPLQKI